MEEDTKPVNSNDQSYHILKTDTFTFCLICLEAINSTPQNIRKHLNGTNHAESITCLFKACNPSLIDDIEDGRFVDIVLKSVFDISVLLGKETCYISKKENYWFCLMCEQNVSEKNVVDRVVKDNIIDHVLSNSHGQKEKGVCFLYRLNGNQDFLLLNKSVLYCSVCNDVMPCKDVDLLKITALHLKLKHPIYAISSGLQYETSSFVKQEELMMMEEGVTDEEIPDDYLNTEFIQRTEFACEVKDENFDKLGINPDSLVQMEKGISLHNNLSKHKEIQNPLNIKRGFNKISFCMCLCCAARLKPVSGQSFVVTLGCHFERYHKNIKTPLDDFINRIIIVDKNNDPKKIKFVSRLRPINKSFKKSIQKSEHFKNYINFIFKSETDYVCIMCLISMSPSSDDMNILLKRFLNHFNSSIHHQCEREQMKINQSFKITKKMDTLIKVTVKKESHKQRLQKFKANRKEKQVKIQPLQFDQNQMGLSKLDETLQVNQEDKQEIDASSNCSKVLLDHSQNHNNSSNHPGCKKRKRKINQPFEAGENSEILQKVKLNRGNLKKKHQGKQAKKNKIQTKTKLLNSKKKQICLSKLNKTPNIDQIMKKEIHAPLNCNVLSEHFKTHSYIPGHTQCENKKDEMNQAVKVSDNSKTLINVQSKKEMLKMKRQRRKAKKKVMQTKIKLLNSNQNHSGLSKHKEKSSINHIEQKEIHTHLDRKQVLLEHPKNHSNSSNLQQNKKDQRKIVKAFKTLIKLTVQKENLKETSQKKKQRKGKNRPK